MEKWELTDEELANLIDIPLCPCDEHCGNCAELRKVATAAGEKARRELAREVLTLLEDANNLPGGAFDRKYGLKVGQAFGNECDYVGIKAWLKERGL